MNLILTVAIAATLLTSVCIVARWGNMTCEGTMPVSPFTFYAILFTSGLDVGLIMFPLTEFPVYELDAAYNFTNPLAVEFGFWGFLVWAFYFLTTFYFCVVEPRVKIFELPAVRYVNNLVVIATCAFTGYLFLSYLPTYLDGINAFFQYGLVGIVVLFAVLSSSDVKYVKILSVSSTWLFFLLIAGMWFMSSMGISGFAENLVELGGYFRNIHRFVSPITDTHAFYLFWWFAWSIMIGQFVSRFLGAQKVWHLLIALLVIPSIPIAVWFSLLYYYHTNAIEISGMIKLAMVIVGIIFVINSLDSLIRLYTANMKLTADRVGRMYYVLGNWAAMFGLILLYQFTPFKIEWVGLIVIGIYIAVYALLVVRRKLLLTPATSN